jgi:hypothetical protein
VVADFSLPTTESLKIKVSCFLSSSSFFLFRDPIVKTHKVCINLTIGAEKAQQNTTNKKGKKRLISCIDLDTLLIKSQTQNQRIFINIFDKSLII